MILLMATSIVGLLAGHAQAQENRFVLRSPEVADGGTLPVDFTGDGGGATLPLEWAGTPEGTASFAVIMHHIDPEGKTKWYWVLYNIPADARRLAKNTSGVGVLGNNSVNGRTGYAPPHSKGPGEKIYIYTVYALSASPQLGVEPAKVSRDVLLAAIKDTILASAELKVVYARQGDREARGSDSGPRDGAPPPPPPRDRGDNAPRPFQDNPTNPEPATRQ